MKVEVLAFGIAKDIFGKKAISIETAAMNTTELRMLLEEQYPSLKNLSSYMIAVNNEYANCEVELKEYDEIAIIPPVSGG